MHHPHQHKCGDHSDAFRRLYDQTALWQSVSFLMLICGIWVYEVLDLPHLFYSQPKTPIDLIGASILTVGVILIGFIVVGQTYLQQRRVLKGFITICSYCKKVNVADQDWEQLERYVVKHSLAEFSHGVCPDCHEHETIKAHLQEQKAAETRAGIRPNAA